jgi:FKBP-type peptidyl-prolyl cis-trans isomerase 2
MDDATLTIDANHELAGQAVAMDVTLVAAVAASERFPDPRTDAQWKAQLGEFQYHVLRMKGTEPGGTGEYDKVRHGEEKSRESYR